VAGTGVGGAPAGGAEASAVTGLSADAKDVYLQAVAHGTQNIFLVGALCAAVAFLAAVFIEEIPLRGAPGSAQNTAKEAGGQSAVTT
jgi:hypothetical protein